MKSNLRSEEKLVLRRQLLAQRARLAETEKASACQEIRRQLLSWPVFVQAKNLMLYLAVGQEPDMDELMRLAHQMGKNIAVPQILPGAGQMEPVRWLPAMKLETGRYGIRQIPAGQREAVDAAALDLVVVPCVALDRRGVRLGMGGGYYDRFLPRLSPDAVAVGVCWHQQFLSELPAEPHDRRLQYVLTENEFSKVVVQDGN